MSEKLTEAQVRMVQRDIGKGASVYTTPITTVTVLALAADWLALKGERDARGNISPAGVVAFDLMARDFAEVDEALGTPVNLDDEEAQIFRMKQIKSLDRVKQERDAAIRRAINSKRDLIELREVRDTHFEAELSELQRQLDSAAALGKRLAEMFLKAPRHTLRYRVTIEVDSVQLEKSEADAREEGWIK